MTNRPWPTNIIVWSKLLVCCLAVVSLAVGTRPSGLAQEVTGSSDATRAGQAISLDRIGATATSQYTGDGLSVVPTPAGARLRSDFQKLNGDATRGGLWVTSTVPGEDARLRLMATRVGRGERTTRLAGSGTVTRREGVVSFVRRGLTEEYSTSVDGVRQDFVIDRRPAGDAPLTVDLALTGATATPASRGAKLTLAGSGRELAYSRLHVVDATGRTLTASLNVLAPKRLAIRVDDADAVYPVRIDPTFSDADWVSMNPGVAGTNHVVNAMVTDASGNLYIGGSFTLVGTVMATNIAKWDGTEWTALGSGAGGGFIGVTAMVASGNDIYVGGAFAQAGGVANTSRIAKWDGSAWSALGTGANNTVSALMLSGGTLYAGGSFTTIGGVAAGGIATWNGTAWTALGGSGTNGAVFALAMIGTDLYVGCNCTAANGVAINRIGKWNGTTWSALGAGSTNTVFALATMGGNLYAGTNGFFTLTAGGSTQGLAMWNPGTSTWTSVGASSLNGGVFSMLADGGDLYIGGTFSSVAGSSGRRGIARWNGGAWSSLSSGTEGPLPGHTPSVSALAMVGADLWAGGTFLSMGGTAAHGLAKWDGSAWSTTGTGLDGWVNAMVMRGADLYIAGNFISAPNGVTVNRIARWNGTTWSALGTGVNHVVYAIAFDAAGNLYAGGRFTIAGGQTANQIAKWNGSNWSPLGTGVTGNPAVIAVAVNSAGHVFVGGNFTGTSAGGVANTNRIARWNGSTWSALATGLDNGQVNSIATIGTDVYVGGTFTAAGGLTLNRVAKWSTVSSTWSALGSGMNNAVNIVVAAGSDLYAGGTFTTAGGNAANRIAKWNGNTWSPLGGGTNNLVNAIAVDGSGSVYVGGGFSGAGSPLVSAKAIGKWDGNAWTGLGSGASGMWAEGVNALALDDAGHLFVGGTFTTVGAGTLSPYLARADVNVNHAPVANAGADQSVAATSGSGATVVLDGAASSDSDGDALTYSWTNDFDGTTLTGAAPSLTVPLGTHVFTLTVTDPGGLTSTDTVPVTVSDALTITSVTPPLAPSTYTFGQVVTASYSCTSSAGLLASCVGTVANGSPINTGSLGAHVFEVTVTNSLGESSSSSWTYEVVKAASSVVVNCPASITYTGAAHTVCTATATGAGMTPVDVSASLMYVNNINVGTVTVSASWAGDTNHNGSAGLGNFAIVTAPVTATFTANSKVYDGTTSAPAAGLSCLLSGVAAGDLNDVVCIPSAAAFDNPNAGGPRTVSATLTLTGSAATNYTFGAPGTNVLSTIATNATTTTTAGVVYGQAGDFTTALSNNTGGVAGVTSASSLITPRGIAADADGNIYLVDQGNARVLFYPFGQTTATRVYGQGGNFTTGIPNNGGISADSLSSSLTRLAVDASGLYVADSGNHRVLFFPTGSTTATRVYGQGGDFSTNTANKGGLSADSLNTPRGMALDDAGNLYLSDTFNNRVLFFPAGSTTATRVYGQDGSFTTSLANNTAGVAGVVSAASLFRPNGLQLDSQGNLYVADASNNRVLVFPSGQTTASRVYGQHGDFTTAIANNGGISADSISTPPNISVDGGDNLYVADSGNHRLLFFPAGSTTATQVYGQAGSFATGVLNNGGVSADGFNLPNSVDLDGAGNIYVSDTNNNRVLRFNASTPSITPAPLVVTASSGTKDYGATFEVAPVYTGFVNSETAAALLSSPVCSSGGSPASAAMGTYATTCSGAAGANYSISYVAGTLTVLGSVPVTATLTAAGKTYDGTTAEPNAGLSCTLSGVLAADLANVTCTASDGTFDSADAGARTVTATVTLGGSAAGNYTFGAAGSVMPSTSASASATIAKATALITVTGYHVTFDGAPHTATGTAIGVLGEDLSTLLQLGNTTHTNAGGFVEDDWTFAGNPNYEATGGFVDNVIDKASSATVVTCPASLTYTGAALESCTAAVTGAGGLTEAVSVSYTNNTNVGTANATATFAGGANHEASTSSATFAITKATSTTTVTCAPATTVYTGAAQELCAATVTGVGGLSLTPNPSYANNTNVGTATASYSYAGDANHEASTNSATFAITKATSTTTVTCSPATTVYTGAAQELCAATVTGVGGLSLTPNPSYANNTNVGTATASYSYAGDANHEASTNSATFAITKASSTTTVTCAPATTVYTGAAQELCAATVTGVGGLNLTPTPVYTDNVNVGTATASYSYAGDANHDVSDASATFAITKATSTTTVTCAPAATVYTGAAQELCAATVTGVGGLNLTPTPVYTGNVNVGTATASYSYAGDANHDTSTASAAFSITPASLTVTPDDKTKVLGSTDPVFTYQVSGLLAGQTATGVLTGSLGRDAGEAAGTYAIRQGTLATNGNYTLTVGAGTLTIGYNTCVLYDPTKAVKSGATIPLKIRLCSATGANVSNSATVVAAVSLMRVSNSATTDVLDAGNSNADGNFRFDPTLGPGYIFNLKTTGLAQGTYRLEIRVTNDPQSHFLTFQVR